MTRRLTACSGRPRRWASCSRRFRFPWRELRKADKSHRDHSQDDDPDQAQGDEKPTPKDVARAAQTNDDGTAVPIPRLDDQPGLLVFRHRSEKLLLVFLVRETPTLGLKKHQLNWGLHLVDAFAAAEEA